MSGGDGLPDYIFHAWAERSAIIACKHFLTTNLFGHDHQDTYVIPSGDNSTTSIERLLSRTLDMQFDIWEHLDITEPVPPEPIPPSLTPLSGKDFLPSFLSFALAIGFYVTKFESSLVIIAGIGGVLFLMGTWSRFKAASIETRRIWRKSVDQCREALKKKSVQLGIDNDELLNTPLPETASEQEEYASELWLRLASLIRDMNERSSNALEDLRTRYDAGDDKAISTFFTLAAISQPKPDIFPRSSKTRYDAATQTLICDTELPSPDDFTNLKQIRTVTLKRGTKTKLVDMSAKQIAKGYDGVIYELALGAIHWIFQQDEKQQAQSIILNGWIQYTHKATGKPTQAFILSLQVSREQFLSLDLANVTPRDCFRHLKGISSPQLYDLVPIAPIVRLDKEDKRFVDGVDIADRLNQGSNLAAIGWEDFEQLIREIFEKEFSSNGGEVKVTRASRDGGVDAVAFDPDPIRGGKIVIQAKRYTNTVDVSAVRDLYGTVMNEGATKGILVTTSSFGPDAYAFVKDKPLTLLDGGNLLFLLERHGHKAYIDLAEAKKLNIPLMRHQTV